MCDLVAQDVQAFTISAGPPAIVAVGPFRASDTQLLLARTAHNFFCFVFSLIMFVCRPLRWFLKFRPVIFSGQ